MRTRFCLLSHLRAARRMMTMNDPSSVPRLFTTLVGLTMTVAVAGCGARVQLEPAYLIYARSLQP
jgi:hypothetical protein